MDKSRQASHSIEEANLEKFAGKTYRPDAICHSPNAESMGYFDRLLTAKLNIVERYADNADALDLCCATGEHLLALARRCNRGTGLDFSEPYIDKARELCAAAGIHNVSFVLGNARAMQFDDASFDLIYCFSSLYVIPDVGEVINEIARVLRPEGKCVLDMGNLYSLNTIVCKAYPELAHPCHIPVWEMKRLLRKAGLTILEHRAFQILPLWGDRPRWLRPLLKPVWKRVLQKQVRGKMLDEWISNLPILKNFAFRHIFLCQKG